MSVVAHFFMSVGGSKIHERLAHFFIDFYSALSDQRYASTVYEQEMTQDALLKAVQKK